MTIQTSSANIQMKATEQGFSVVLFIMLHKVVLPFDSVYIQMKAIEKSLSRDVDFVERDLVSYFQF